MDWGQIWAIGALGILGSFTGAMERPFGLSGHLAIEGEGVRPGRAVLGRLELDDFEFVRVMSWDVDDLET